MIFKLITIAIITCSIVSCIGCKQFQNENSPTPSILPSVPLISPLIPSISSISSNSSVPSPTQHIDLTLLPIIIIEKANQYIISQVGEDYFHKYFTYDPSNSRYQQADLSPNGAAWLRYPHYYMAYTFKIPEKPFVNVTVGFLLNTDGKLIPESEPTGIPNILNNPQEGQFPIDAQMAIDIAKNASLEPGIKPWKTDFHWYAGTYKRYVWTVENTLFENIMKELNGMASGGARGKVVVIDANTGSILMTNGWMRIYN
jgi:hypothetical protein